MVLIHHIALGTHILVDEHWQAVGARANIQPPICIRVLYRFQLITDIIVVQIILGIVPQLEAHIPESLGQLGEGNRSPLLGLLRHIQPTDEGDGADFSERLIDKGREEPPDPVLVRA